ncbi:DarT ssDNA thymidine ADP-ribosyltransferase family protein [Ruegeria atlantica]|uniref:DarT ssDNA thymidine ADP-ribosyltransferase family protein n=1 Tax=Ruegeria atlantica TaxID=81569 RepID=UPI00147C727D|nr:DarT ssDNA thymidine ADP-ribosyltransferase family protein [Ruegeria atlantica]
MALLVLLLCRELIGFASHSRGDPLISNDVLYQLSNGGFTKYSNFPSIMANGLLRRTELDRRDLAYDFNDDMRLDGHPDSLSVSIGFPNYRMFYPARQKYTEDTWIVLVLSTDILTHKTCAGFPVFPTSNSIRTSR